MLLECPAEKPARNGASLAWRLSGGLVGMGAARIMAPFPPAQKSELMHWAPVFLCIPFSRRSVITLIFLSAQSPSPAPPKMCS